MFGVVTGIGTLLALLAFSAPGFAQGQQEPEGSAWQDWASQRCIVSLLFGSEFGRSRSTEQRIELIGQVLQGQLALEVSSSAIDTLALAQPTALDSLRDPDFGKSRHASGVPRPPLRTSSNATLALAASLIRDMARDPKGADSFARLGIFGESDLILAVLGAGQEDPLVDLAESFDSAHLQVSARRDLAILMARHGYLSGAESLLERVPPNSDLDERSQILGEISQARARQGDFAGAERATREIEDPGARAETLFRLSAELIAENRVAAGRRLFEEGLAFLDRKDERTLDEELSLRDFGLFSDGSTAVIAAFARKDPQEAAWALLEMAKRTAEPLHHASLAVELPVVAAELIVRGDLDRARRVLELALTHWQLRDRLEWPESGYSSGNLDKAGLLYLLYRLGEGDLAMALLARITEGYELFAAREAIVQGFVDSGAVAGIVALLDRLDAGESQVTRTAALRLLDAGQPQVAVELAARLSDAKDRRSLFEEFGYRLGGRGDRSLLDRLVKIAPDQPSRQALRGSFVASLVDARDFVGAREVAATLEDPADRAGRLIGIARREWEAGGAGLPQVASIESIVDQLDSAVARAEILVDLAWLQEDLGARPRAIGFLTAAAASLEGATLPAGTAPLLAQLGHAQAMVAEDPAAARRSMTAARQLLGAAQDERAIETLEWLARTTTAITGGGAEPESLWSELIDRRLQAVPEDSHPFVLASVMADMAEAGVGPDAIERLLFGRLSLALSSRPRGESDYPGEVLVGTYLRFGPLESALEALQDLAGEPSERLSTLLGSIEVLALEGLKGEASAARARVLTNAALEAFPVVAGDEIELSSSLERLVLVLDRLQQDDSKRFGSDLCPIPEGESALAVAQELATERSHDGFAACLARPEPRCLIDAIAPSHAATEEQGSRRVSLLSRLLTLRDPGSDLGVTQVLVELLEQEVARLEAEESGWGLRLGPDSVKSEAAFALSQVSARLGSFDRALRWAQRIGDDPGWTARALAAVAVEQARRGDREAALDHIWIASEMTGLGDAWGWHAIARAQLALGNVAAAQQAALRIDATAVGRPVSARVVAEIAAYQLSMGKEEAARDTIESVYDPDLRVIADASFAPVLAEAHDAASAISSLSRITDPSVREVAVEATVSILLARGDWESAREVASLIETDATLQARIEAQGALAGFAIARRDTVIARLETIDDPTARVEAELQLAQALVLAGDRTTGRDRLIAVQEILAGLGAADRRALAYARVARVLVDSGAWAASETALDRALRAAALALRDYVHDPIVRHSALDVLEIGENAGALDRVAESVSAILATGATLMSVRR